MTSEATTRANGDDYDSDAGSQRKLVDAKPWMAALGGKRSQWAAIEPGGRLRRGSSASAVYTAASTLHDTSRCANRVASSRVR